VYQLTTYIYDKARAFKLKLMLIYSILSNFGEEYYIRNHRRNLTTVPKHVGIIIAKQPFNEVIENLLKIIYWSLVLNFKYITYYDPFNVINATLFTNSIQKFFRKYKIAIKVKGTTITMGEKQDKETSPSSANEKETYDIYVNIINFKESNQELLHNIDKENKKQDILYPKTLEYLKMIYANDKDIKNNSGEKIKKLYTLKEKEFLPELILYTGKDEICLYGFPFTLIENAEIIKVGDISRINVIKFVQAIEGYNNISKRFGK